MPPAQPSKPPDPNNLAKIALTARAHPEFFVSAVLGSHLWSKQAEILNAVRDHRRVAVRSGHGTGKTKCAAFAALWFLMSYPQSRVITTAPTWSQVEQLLWREIRAEHTNARIPLGGVLSSTKLELGPEWVAMGLSTDVPERFQGHHAEHLLLIVDEASGVDEAVYIAGEGFLTSANARILLIGNPTRNSGQFYRAFHSERDTWHRLSISAFDSPTFTGERAPPSVASRLVTRCWVDEHRQLWGADSPLWQVRVLGEFPTESENTVISLVTVEAAQARESVPSDGEPPPVVACDVARFGADSTVIVTRQGNRVRIVHTSQGADLMQTCGAIIQTEEALREGHDRGYVRIVIDDDGVGGGVTDRLREQGYTVEAFNAGGKPHDGEHYVNRRAEMWFSGRDMLEDSIDLDPDEQLAAELVASEYKFDSRGRFQIEPKDQIKKRLGRSPDRADAVLMALTQPKRRLVADIGPVSIGGESSWRR